MENELIVNENELVFKKQIELVNMILSAENEIHQLKSEENKISAKRKYLENKLEEFKGKIKKVFEENGIDKIETEVGKIALRKCPVSVEVIDIEKIPQEYKTEKITVNVNKKAIIDNFKTTGELIDGVKINTENNSLQVI